MANLRGRIFAQDSSRNKIVSRLASQHITVKADTWRTFVTVNLSRDGSGEIIVSRIENNQAANPEHGNVSMNRTVIHTYLIEAE